MHIERQKILGALTDTFSVYRCCISDNIDINSTARNAYITGNAHHLDDIPFRDSQESVQKDPLCSI